MKQKKFLKVIILSMFLFIILLNVNVSIVKARDPDASEHVNDNVVKSEDLGLGSNLSAYVDRNTTSYLFKNKISKLLAAVKYVGVVLSVIILIIIGMKYMLGSVEEKADYKKTMMPYIYGTFFLFAGSFVPQLIYDIVKNIGWI